MKKILLLGTILMIVGTAYAFGGGGGGRTGRAYDRGLNAIGIHRGGDGQADIKFKCDDPNAHPDDQGVCVCNDGYVEDAQGICVQNQCEGFTPTECITACDPATGEKTYATLCHNDEYYCNNNHECVNPCEEAQYNTECQTCTPTGGNADIQDKTGTCGTGGAYICQAGACIDPCTIGDHPTDACTPSWHAENGECIPDYAPTGTSCGTNMTCNADHECTCLTGYFWNGSACFAPCTKPNYFHRLSGTCLACDSNTRVETTADECTTCGDQRKVITDGDKTYCATTNCGSGNFQDAKGTCHACTISTAYPVKTEADCTTPCPGTRHVDEKTDGTLSCVNGPCPTERTCGTKCCPTGHPCSEGQCMNPETYCPADKPIMAANGTCRACPSGTDNLRFSAYSADECAKCGDGYLYNTSEKACYIETCPAGHFRTSPYYCQHCQAGWNYHVKGATTEADIDRCVAACPNRQKMPDGYKYSSIACTYNCTDFGQVRDEWGNCKTCESDIQYWSSSCNLCPGKNFKKLTYSDNCELVSSCPEGEHVGTCCPEDTVYVQTGTKKEYNATTTYSTGVCCPKFRPVWDGSKCVPQES